jgi:alanyl-tRNA synthetase
MPYEMLEDVAERNGLKVDKALFESFLDRQRKLSRAKTKIKSEIFSETFAKKVESLGLATEFLGYEKSHAEAKVIEVLPGGEVILDRTPFYGESGGQVGDWGKIETPSGAMEVEDAKKIGRTIVHIGKMIRGVAIKKGETAKVSIDDDARKRVMANHTATHLLQAALRKVLGDHVRQTGSLVDDAHLRFDFTHMKKMEPREVARVEEIVNDGIRKAIHVKKDIMSLEEAKRDGATALFGEKYEDRVRVVSIGDLSKELCGGTHVNNTRDIGAFRITSESSIASGVRRIEALTGKEAEEWITKKAAEESARMKAESDKDAAKKAMQVRTREELSNIDKFISRSKAKGGSRIIVENINGVDMDCLRALSDAIRSKEKSAAIVLATVAEEKASFIVSVTEDLVAKGVKAGDIAREMAGMIEGSGGGKPSFAQGGGKAPQRLGDALGKIGEYLGGKI